MSENEKKRTDGGSLCPSPCEGHAEKEPTATCVECHKRPAEICGYCATRAEREAALDAAADATWAERERCDEY